MGKTKTKPAVEPDPIEVPLYTLADVARYLRLPVWGVVALTGRFQRLEQDYFHHFRRGLPFPPMVDGDLLLPPQGKNQDRITFRRLADHFVWAAVFDVLAGWPWGAKPQQNRWETFSLAVLRGFEDVYRQPVPFDDSPIGDRVEALSAHFGDRLNPELLALLRKWLTLRLERVETHEGKPIRIYPFSRDPANDSPRLVVLDPHVRFGRPTLASRGLPTDVLAERFRAGDTQAELAEDYGLPTAEVEEALRSESLPG